MREEREGEDESEGGKKDLEKSEIQENAERKKEDAGTQGAGQRRIKVPKKRRRTPLRTAWKGV